MAIKKKLIHFNKKEDFSKEISQGNILPTSIVFIKDTKELWTHGEYYSNVLTKLSELENDLDLVSREEVEELMKDIPALDTTEINNRLSALESIDHSLYLTEHQDISGKADKSEVDTLSSTINSEITRAKAAEAVNSNLISTETARAKAAEDEIRQGISSTSTADGGDIPVMPLYREAETLYTKVAESISSTATLAAYITSYNKPYIGKPFNRIKMMIGTPGRCRISIFNENIFKPNPTIENSLVRDLVNVLCSSTGYHYWDLDEDVTIEEGQFIGSWYTTDCARYTYSSALTYMTSYPSGWIGRTNLMTTEVTKETYENNKALGYLNIGLYRKGSLSDFEYGKLDESATSASVISSSYAFIDLEKLVGKTIYKLKINAASTGSFTVHVLNDYNKPTASIYKSWKLYVRQLGVLQVRLPEDIILEPGQGLAFYSEDDTCKFYYGGSDFGTKYSLGGYIIYRGFNLSTQELVTANRLNIGVIERGGKITTLEDRTISIQGDSISTFEGSITPGNAVFYSTKHKFVNSIDATWWGLLVNECRMRLVANDAWSGSKISGTGAGAMSSTQRCSKLKGTDVNDETVPFSSPEIVVVMCGTNDIGGNVSLGDIDSTDVSTYCGAFRTMIQRLKSNMPNAKIVVFLLYRGNSWDYANSGGTKQYLYMDAMEKLCKRYGAHYISPERFGFDALTMKQLTCDNAMTEYGGPSTGTADYLHPNMQGMERIYAGVRSFLETLY